MPEINLLETFDARDWAKEFIELNQRHARVHVLEFEDGTQVRQPTPFTPAEAARAKFYFQSQSDASDEEIMISWFANALMKGWDEHRFRSKEYKREIRRILIPWWKRPFIPLDSFGRKGCTAIALCLLLVLPLAGCASFDRATFNTLSVSNSVLKTAQVDYETGKLPHNACVYNLINKGKTMQNVAETAFLDEWTTEQAKGDVTASQAALAADLADLAPVVLSLKTLYTNPNCTGGAQ